MKLILLFILAFKATSAFAHDYIVMPESSANELFKTCSRNSPAYETTFTPTKGEIAALENNISKLMSLESNECCGKGKISSSISNYYRQYIGVIIDSKRYIYINAGNKEYSNLSADPISTCDGGKDWWGALFNITEIKFSHLAFNGEI